MDISHGDGATAVAPATARELVPLTVLTAAPLMAGIVGVRLSGLMISRVDEFSTVAPFGGWQLYAVAAAIGTACLIVLVGTVSLARRRYRSVRERSSYHRVALMGAILPGLLLGIAVGSTVRPALSWASDHTSAAARERSVEKQMEAHYRAGPPTVSYHGVSSSDPSLTRLLDPRDLGPDWNARYDSATVVGQLSIAGQLSSVRAVLHEQHWSNNAWRTDMIVMEELKTFRSPSDARLFSASWVQQRDPSSMTTRAVNGVRVNVETVHSAGYPVYHHAEFTHGRYAVLLYPFANFTPTSPASSFPMLLRTAVARAG